MKTLCQALFSVLFLSLALTVHTQSYEESFDDGLPSDWLEYTEAGFDFVNWFDGDVSLFKQSDGDEIIMLATPEFDLSQYTRMEIDYYGLNLAFGSETVPEMHVGILETPGDFSTFRSIYELNVTNTNYQLFRIDIGAYKQMSNLCFKLKGERSHIIYVDNFKLYDDNFESNVPVAVQNIEMVAAIDGSNTFSISWDNPAFEADGDELTDLDGIGMSFEGQAEFLFNSPMIGERLSEVLVVDTPGQYKFEVIPVNSAGIGHRVFTPSMWIGLDQPGPVRNIEINQNEDQVRLQWDLPNIGANGSFFDGNVDAYTIIRSDGKEFLVPGSEAEFMDILDAEGSIRYQIIAENGSGKGTPAFSDAIFYVTDDHLYYENFDFDIVSEPGANLTYAHAWTNQSNVNNSYWDWFSSNFIGENAGELSWLWTGSGSPNDMVSAVSPKINTAGFDAVSLTYNYYFESAGTSPYTVLIQTSSDGGTSWTNVEAIEISNFTQGSYTKTIANADVGSEQFQFAFTRLGPANQNPFMRIDNIRLRNQPGVDLRAVDIDVPKTVEPGTELSLLCYVENNSSSLNTGRVKCVIKNRYGDQDVVTSFDTEINDMPIGQVIDLNYGPWTAVEGEYIIELSIANDQDAVLDNNILTQALNVYRLQERQLVVIEEFSGTWCAFCPGAALAVEDLYDEGYDVAAITYHRSDAYETDIVESRMDLYSILGFPTSIFDGTTKSEGGDVSMSIIDEYRPIVENLKAIKAPARIDFRSAELSSVIPGEDKTYDVSIHVTSESIIQDPNLSLVAVITESEIEEEWQGLNVLDYVQREFDTKSVNLSSGDAIVNFSFVLDGEIDIEHSDIIVFVQSEDDNEIYNGNALRVSNTIEPSATNDVQFLEHAVFPNPARNAINLRLKEEFAGRTQFIIRDISGKIVNTNRFNSNIETIDISALKSGIYMLELIQNDQKSNYRFIKQ